MLGSEALIVNVAEATLFSAGDAGFTLHDNRVDEGVQVRLSVPLNSLTEVRFKVTVPLLPPGTVI